MNKKKIVKKIKKKRINEAELAAIVVIPYIIVLVLIGKQELLLKPIWPILGFVIVQRYIYEDCTLKLNKGYWPSIFVFVFSAVVFWFLFKDFDISKLETIGNSQYFFRSFIGILVSSFTTQVIFDRSLFIRKKVQRK